MDLPPYFITPQCLPIFLQTFTPQLGDLYTMLSICGFGFVALVFLAFRLNRLQHPDPRRRVLLPMLAYFMALLALMGFLGTFWSVFKYPTVEVAGNRLIVDGEAYPRPSTANIRLENYASGGLGGSSRVLLVQTKDRKTWAFPDDRYPVTELLRALRDE